MRREGPFYDWGVGGGGGRLRKPGKGEGSLHRRKLPNPHTYLGKAKDTKRRKKKK